MSPYSPIGELLTRGSPGTSSAGAGAKVGAVEGAGTSVSDKVGRTTGLATFFFRPFGIVEYGSLLMTIKKIYI